MKDAQKQIIHLKDYQQPDYWIEQTDLTVDLHEDITEVTARLNFRINDTKRADSIPDLVLHGQEMELKSVAVDGQSLSESQYVKTSETLTLTPPGAAFSTEIITHIKPQENKSLEGLYKSSDMYCTQCEAEGFRKITYYLDRPDVMSRFTTRIIADKNIYPVLLSNGNIIDSGVFDDNRHWVVWEDPFAKPSYLFALVAGNLECIEDIFFTMSGREVGLRIFTEAHNITRCAYAMASLKRAMAWDESVYGREYDLNNFMIVAVDDFNMGAMENKGLNIFNSSCVLASADTATDATFLSIEGIVGHEYFHNWSGNRVTCRDWFQLSLKEGFTVFRDQEFSADMNSATVQRIEDVNILRNAQFKEDAGPMAHPIRPDAFIEISNFYTSTVYNKGAEVVRMIYNILGKKGFRKGSDLYFKRHDGQAVTCDDFTKAMEDANGIDLAQFKRWYSQAGTPILDVTDQYDESSQQYTLTVKQHCPDTPGQKDKLPFHIPVAVSLFNNKGDVLNLNSEGMKETVLHVKETEQEFTFNNIDSRPLPSLLRDFSAPVKLNYDYSRDDLILLINNDTDGFNRWESGQRLAVDILMEQVKRYQAGKELSMDNRLIQVFRHLLNDNSLDKAMIAKILILPAESYLGEQMEAIDIEAIHAAREFTRYELAKELYTEFVITYDALNVNQPYHPKAEDIAKRQLKNICLSYMLKWDDPRGLHKTEQQLAESNNMTDTMAALSSLIYAGCASAENIISEHLKTFAEKWKDDANVMDMWFSLQARADTTKLNDIKRLMQHDSFDFKNPNKVRALIGAFCSGNLINFHAKDSSGYTFLAEQVIAMDKFNPQMASRLMMPLTHWQRYASSYQAGMKKALELIRQQAALSPDVFEVVSRSLDCA